MAEGRLYLGIFRMQSLASAIPQTNLDIHVASFKVEKLRVVILLGSGYSGRRVNPEP